MPEFQLFQTPPAVFSRFQVTRVHLQQATCSQAPGPARGNSGLDLSVFHWDQVCHCKALKVQYYRDLQSEVLITWKLLKKKTIVWTQKKMLKRIKNIFTKTF